VRRAGRIVKGLGAFVLLVVLVGVIPWALWHFVGWPLPHHVPSTSQIGRALNHQGIPDQVLVDALAVVVWITWASLIASVAVEVPAALSGRHASRLPLAGAFQPFTGKLVAAVIVAGLALAPRPAHAGAVGGGGSLAGLATTATLVVPNITLTADAKPVATVTEASTTVATPAPAAPEPPSVRETYVVQRGDTLWGIAQRELGDPLRWSEIYQLNEGRPQPGGVTLSDPHWIDPGWTLLLPASATPLAAPPPAPTQTASPAASPPSQSEQLPTTVPTTTAPTTMVTSPTTESAADPAHHAVSHRADHGAEPVRLPSGSVVAGSFAAGVAATIAIGRLRRRHAYRYRPPRPANTWDVETENPTVTQLRLAAAPDDDGDEFAAPRSLIDDIDDVERRQRAELVEIGLRDGVAVTVELTELSGLTLEGGSADDAVRALVDALLVRAGPGAAEVLVPEALATRLLPGLGALSAVRRSATIGQAATALEAERVMRGRWLEEAGASDAKVFRTQNPEHPFPMLLAVVEMSPQDPTSGQWAALAGAAGPLGMAVLFLGASPDGCTTVRLDESRRVLSVESDDGLRFLQGVELFGLQADEAVAVLSAVVEDEGSGLEDPGELREESDFDADSPDHRTDRGIDDMWQVAEEGEVRPVTVRMFGHLEISAGGEVIASGLRARGRDLLAWYMLHPSGSTSDEAVEALWRDTEPDRVHGQFWRSFSDLRSCLRSRCDLSLEVLTKVGEHYRPAAGEIDCDLWTFQSALAEAAESSEQQSARRALRRAVDIYRGELLTGDDRPWVEPVRQNLHRRALDAHLRLAELEAEAGHSEAAVELLERAIERDRYAEEPYRRLMMLHGARGRVDAVQDVWRLLQARLAELDLDVEDATATLYRQLTSTSTDRERVRRASSVS
jgi:DNA-binding SARP family transcriptional activator